jgi:hypothetical protein
MTQLGRGQHGRRSGAIAGRGSFAALTIACELRLDLGHS